MINKFLYELQKDILNKRGMYILYLFVTIPSFIITIENIRICINIFRIFLSSIALLCFVLIYLQCGSVRNKKEDRIIIHNIFFFSILTVVCIYDFLK